jgi:hypothetical protein
VYIDNIVVNDFIFLHKIRGKEKSLENVMIIKILRYPLRQRLCPLKNGKRTAYSRYPKYNRGHFNEMLVKCLLVTFFPE